MGEGEIMGRAKVGDIALRVASVLIAILLWVVAMNEDNPTIQDTITGIPVKLVNMDSLAQSKLIFMGAEDAFKVKLYVEGKEKDIEALKLKPESIVLEADLSTSGLAKGNNTILFEIKKKPDGINIPLNQPMYINVELDELVDKVFPVEVAISGPAKPGYALQPETVEPQQVMLHGAAKYIGSVNKVQAKVDASNATTDITTSVALQVLDAKGSIIPDKQVSCDPKSVNVVVPIKKAKEVPVVLRTTGSLPQGVTIRGDFVINPATVSITGDESVVNSIDSIDTVPMSLSGITQSTTRQVRLSIPAGVTVLDDIQTVNVGINVDRTITKTFTVPVRYENLPDGLKSTPAADNINVTLSGQESALNNLSSDSIMAVVDLSGVAAEDAEYEFTPVVTPPDGFTIAGPIGKIKVKITKKQG